MLPLDRGAQTDIHRLPKGLFYQQRPDSVLADVLIDGPTFLLGVTLDGVHHYFIRRPEKPWLEMTERLYIRNGKSQVMDGNNYLNQLQLYFIDCPEVLAQLAHTPFTEAGMIALVQTYTGAYMPNELQNRVYYEPEKAGRLRTTISAGVLVGGRFNSHRLKTTQALGVERPALQGVDADGQMHLQGGAFLDVVTPARRSGLHLDILLSQYGRRGTLSMLPTGRVASGTFSWRGTLLATHVGMRGFRSLGEHYRAFAGTGMELNWFWQEKNTLHYTGQSSGGPMPPSFTYKFVDGFARSFAPYLEAGVQTKRFSFSLNGRVYRKNPYWDHLILRDPNDLANFQGYEYTGRTWSVGLLLGYRLIGKPDTQLK
ncbi:hypothetical protein [Hymenobacter qilianensis]|uniref:hypothetical protein n=1 Tax=Hymenobacter qilianensis TaxID=1385715 RepID=UPI0016634542|nr:hypothetical protein [Hymenobacter qilianensis]